MGEMTPMMQQYMATKEQYKDCILFYRLGDFYEMFFDDAKVASKELELTLTGKNCGMEERAPMCGIPYHAADTYLNRLVKKGYKVAICEQLEDPAQAKGIVKRDVIRIVTPGTNLDNTALSEDSNNYIASIYSGKDGIGLAVCDITTSDFMVTVCDNENKLFDELYKISPAEILHMNNFTEEFMELIDNRINTAMTVLDSSYFDFDMAESRIKSQFSGGSLESLGLHDFKMAVPASGALLLYLMDTQKSDLSNIKKLSVYMDKNFMMIDSSTRRNLELTCTMREKEKKGSLLWVLDKTKTAMGARCLKHMVEQPLYDINEIIRRQDAIEELNGSLINREELREYLSPIYDLERLMTKIAYGSANPRDLIAFRQSISMLVHIKTLLSDFNGTLLKSLNSSIDPLSDLYTLVDNALLEDAPISARDGDLIKNGYNANVDKLRSAKTDGKQWLFDLEQKELNATGIKNLRIKYNKVFGYYFEVTNSYQDLVPDYFIRKQTLANAERYYTPELKELEDTILSASDKLNALEYELFKEVRDEINNNMGRVLDTARAIASLDAILSLAYVSEQNHYVRPQINDRGIIDIKEGRHPVVEKMIPADQFVCNDTYLDNDRDYIAIITGPNMAGKSTYMRQVALIVLMAQVGCFVPAKEATIGIVDRIFTRVGASDDLSTGQSTFMVEMNEVANILKNATKKSLLILDEIGRGTSTYDGLSIAWAVVEYISDKTRLGAKSLFATHYHELTELEGKLSGVGNYRISVAKEGKNMIFLRKIVRGGANESYGIEVARLAGVPDEVLNRADEIAVSLNLKDTVSVTDKLKALEQLNVQKQKEETHPAVEFIKKLDASNVTPLEAINLLYQLKDLV